MGDLAVPPSKKLQEVVKEEVERMKKLGVIVESQNEW